MEGDWSTVCLAREIENISRITPFDTVASVIPEPLADLLKEGERMRGGREQGQEDAPAINSLGLETVQDATGISQGKQMKPRREKVQQHRSPAASKTAVCRI